MEGLLLDAASDGGDLSVSETAAGVSSIGQDVGQRVRRQIR